MCKMKIIFFQTCIFTMVISTVGFHLNLTSRPIPSSASALLAFKSKADMNNNLSYSMRTSLAFCKWEGVQCSSKAKVVRLVLENLLLGGTFPPDSLTKLKQLRVLSLQNNSLTGPIPDISSLSSLKVLFLDQNYFSGTIPPSIPSLYHLKILDLSHNSLTGQIPISLNNLDLLNYLRLDFNRFNGSLPPLNQTTLKIFNVSHNDLSGPIPITPTFARFKDQAFLTNPGLCGELIHKECNSRLPFFAPAPSVHPPPPRTPLAQNAQLLHGVELSQVQRNKHKRTALIVGISTSLFIFLALIIIFVLTAKYRKDMCKSGSKASTSSMVLDPTTSSANAEAVISRIEEENYELEEKVKRMQEGMDTIGRSGNLVFCAGEEHVYTMEQLMRASAELLGRGTLGTTYKAVIDNRLILCVKRLDGGRFAGASTDVFERHMESLGMLRHPNLVPLRAFFHAKEERLLVYDHQPNGSLFSLIHGSRSPRSKPLHWTSCLKIAEDIAQGLSYIHQAWRLAHANLKSSNVLLGSDFEACVGDYCLSAIASIAVDEDPDNLAYKAPEIRKFNYQKPNSKSDVYTFGVLLIELLTGKRPSQHPYLMPHDMVDWVRFTRDENSGEDNRFEMLLEVAMACNVQSPEQRPTMWQVLKMLQDIKRAVIMDEVEMQGHS
ncbi:transmembrane signal receptor [Lithospermum erythrorhizon]|uniref:Transmembrane signal receptor n=1 Tax=Lithospermum erythrorhizon TaxID=34254 RepID=A0AAV3QN92_LITER